jgi:hypothetical protein
MNNSLVLAYRLLRVFFIQMLCIASFDLQAQTPGSLIQNIIYLAWLI